MFRFGSISALVIAIVFAIQSFAIIEPRLQRTDIHVGDQRADGSKADPLDVVLIADTSGATKFVGTDMASGFQDAVRSGGVTDEIRLIVRDDGGRSEAVSALAEGSASGFRTLAMVGPSDAQGFQAFRTAANEGEVPALVPVGSPARDGNGKWTFTLQSSNFKSGQILGRILQRVASGPRIAEITLQDAPHDGLWGGIIEAYKDKGAETLEQITWPKNIKPEAVKALLADNLYFDAIVITLPMPEAEMALRQLRNFGYEGTIVVEGEASLEDFALRFKNDAKEKISEGYFTDGVLSLVPFTPSIANSDSQNLISKYITTHSNQPSWAYAYGYDSGMIIARFVRDLKKTGNFTLSNPDKMRSELRKFLVGMNLSPDVLHGFTGALGFEDSHERDIPPKLVIYKGRKQSPYFVQVSDQPALLRANDPASNYVRLGDLGYRIIPVVHVGLNMRSVSNINFDMGTFDALFDVWFKSKDKIDINDILFMNQIGDLRLAKLVENRSDSTSQFEHYLIGGQFQFHPTPADIILDQTNVVIHFRHRQLDNRGLKFVLDPEGFDSSALSKPQDKPASLGNIVGFNIASNLLAVEDKSIESLGDPRGAHGAITYSVATFQASVVRNISTVTSQIVRLLGPDIVHTLFAAVAVLFLGLTIVRLFRTKKAVAWLFYIGLGTVALLSETALFTSDVVTHLNTDSLTLLRLLYAVIYIFVVVRIIDMVLLTYVRNADNQSVQPVLMFLIRVSLYFGGCAFFYTSVLGRDILPVLATFSVFLTVVGLALREIIFDAIAGIAIATDGNIEIGQWINIRARDRNISGAIESMGWRFVSVRSRDEHIHFIPNSVVATQILSNLSMAKGYVRVEIPFSISARINFAHIRPMIIRCVDAALLNNPDIDHSRHAKIILEGLEDERLRCAVQIFYAADKSTDSLRTIIIDAIRQSLVEENAFSQLFLRLMPNEPTVVSGPTAKI